MDERWAPIPGWPYEASDQGRIRRSTGGKGAQKGKILSSMKSQLWQYKSVLLYRGGRETSKRFNVHQLVMLAFVGEPPPDHQVNHKDGNKANNRLENLEYVTISENHLHAYETGLRSYVPKRLAVLDVLEIRDRAKAEPDFEALAEDYGVSVDTIRNVVHRRTYQDV